MYLSRTLQPTIFKNYVSYLQPQNQPETAKRLDFSAKEHSFSQQAINESLIPSEEARNKFSLATFQDLKLKPVDYTGL